MGVLGPVNGELDGTSRDNGVNVCGGAFCNMGICYDCDAFCLRFFLIMGVYEGELGVVGSV